MRIRQQRPAAKGSAAFTLVEVVISVLVIAIGSAGLMSCIGYGFKSIQRIRENQRATQIILEKAETIRLYSWDQVNTSGFIPSAFTATYDGDSAGSNYTGTIYYGTVSVGSFPGFTSYIAKDGIQNYVY
jgi:type II secretory pathway pseudopilin PulG